MIEGLMLCLVQLGWPCNACPPPTTLQDSQCSSQVGFHSVFHTKNKAPPRKKNTDKYITKSLLSFIKYVWKIYLIQYDFKIKSMYSFRGLSFD